MKGRADQARVLATKAEAVELRYDDIYPTREEASAAWETVKRLRHIMQGLLPSNLV